MNIRTDVLRLNRDGCLLWPLALTTLLLAGCVGLIRPNYSQEITELRAGEYSLDPEHAYVLFRVGHLGLSTVVGRFNRVSASLDFDPEKLGALRLDGVIDIASIDLNNEDLERRLLGADWFDTELYPEANFSTVDAVQGIGNTFILHGNLSLHGITRALSLEATFNGGADNLLTGRYTLGFSAQGKFLRSDYGVDALAALVSDEVTVEIHAEFQRTP
ncbi:MAG: YceI family protein [Granulosicoccus sp.]